MTAAFVAAVVVLLAFALPPARLAPVEQRSMDAVAGAFHVHSSRSDGRSSPDEIAAIAARAGLQFVVFTDHGDATRAPDRPTYRSGVLCIDAVEISTTEGHLIALGMPTAPYRLAGDARDVVEDIHRLGGIAIAAHPDSPKTDLQWRDWSVPLDGLELINLDTMWRKQLARRDWRSRLRVVGAVMTYLLRGPETIASLGSDGPELASDWARLAAIRPTAIFAGTDAHARLELRDTQPGDNRGTLPLPGYENTFKTLTMRVPLAKPLSGDAASDGASILDALQRGAAYGTVDGILAPGAFEFSGATASTTFRMGETATTDGPLTLTIRTNAPASFTTIVWRNDEVLSSTATAPDVTVAAPAGDAAYRVEIRASDRPGAPRWLIGNPLYVRTAPRAAAVAPPAANRQPGGLVLFDTERSGEWRTEASPASKAALDVTRTADGRALLLRYGLPRGEAFGEYAAAVVSTAGGVAPYDALRVTARADRPMRISVQLRTQVPGVEADRWQRSIYLDSTDTSHVLPFADFRPVGVPQSPQLSLAAVGNILFMIDRGNTKPGSSGRLWLTAVALRAK
jgi:hypothetical protein